MESLCRSSFRPKTPLLSLRPTLKPSFITLPKRSYLLNASKSSHEQNPSKLLSVLKPLSLTLATAAASLSILLSRFPSVALASVVSPPSEALTEPNFDEIASLRAEMETKIEQGDFVAGIKILEEIIVLDPQNSDLVLLKGHLEIHTGDVSSAKRSFESILQNDPFLVEAFHGLIMAASQSDSSSVELEEILKRVEKTIELCVKEKQDKEKVRDFKLLIAQIKVVKGEYEESLEVYGELEREEPTDFRPYLCKGIVYAMLGKNDEAEKQFEKYKKLVPEGHPYQNMFEDFRRDK
ncbi:hypothetical protein LUZ60_012990 [Juncus effusus]|nr:hypothetical protein LUZ60_012990 [Juncus effusus]